MDRDRSGTSLRLVEPQRVQIHSAVVAGTVMSAADFAGSELLESAANQLGCLLRGACRECRPHRIVGRCNAVAQAHQSPDCLLGAFQARPDPGLYDEIAEAILQLEHQAYHLLSTDAAHRAQGGKVAGLNAPDGSLGPQSREQLDGPLGTEAAGAQQMPEHQPLDGAVEPIE